ncbi:NAD-dependent epimerase/dehydratase family protein [Paenibacillus ihumii]|uniref:NAD-dependent epimerase/dehydratase family protein n=1 Tax=Paenibacillus ihumii TaxID=687436 RepID=UPI000939514D|nr:NAD-dependent epimerase/dehydratase family protein [Paenibacillus ihumii]
MLKGKRVFVSGGAGVIGTELVSKLIDAGATVFVGDLKPRPEHWPKSVRYRQGDLNEITKDELLEFSPEYFFHLAATFERSEESYEFWDENERHNVNLSHHLMDCLKDCTSLERVVFASSYLIYNPELYQFEQAAASATSLIEHAPIYPRNLCGAAKLMHEIELRFLQQHSTAHYTAVSARIYRVYGKNSRDIISRWIQALLNNETIQVYRKEGMFDYIYANDVAEGLLRLAISEATGVVNLGNGNARKVEEVLNVLKLHFPSMKMIEGVSDIPYEASQADMTYYEVLTGWRPERQIEDTIPELITHYRSKQGTSLQQAGIGAVMVSSVSRKVPLLKCIAKGIQKLGQPIQIVGADSNANALGRYFTDSFWQMPRLDQMSFEELLAACVEQNIKYIIPTRDGELTFFSEYKQQLYRKGIHVMVSDPEAVETCLDKLKFYRRGLELGFSVIPTEEQMDHLKASSLVVKERYGAGSESIGLNLSQEEALIHALTLKEPVYQPYIPGEEVSVDVYVQKNGRCKAAVVRKRELVVNGESQITTTFREEALELQCAEFAEKLGLYGHAVFQVMIDQVGGYHFIECNSRFGGASRLSIEAGLDSFYWFLLEAAGSDLEEYPFVRSAKEKRLVRYAEDLIQ